MERKGGGPGVWKGLGKSPERKCCLMTWMGEGRHHDHMCDLQRQTCGGEKPVSWGSREQGAQRAVGSGIRRTDPERPWWAWEFVLTAKWEATDGLWGLSGIINLRGLMVEVWSGAWSVAESESAGGREVKATTMLQNGTVQCGSCTCHLHSLKLKTLRLQSFSHTSLIPNAPRPHVASGYGVV